jgi:hypothetical protein
VLANGSTGSLIIITIIVIIVINSLLHHPPRKNISIPVTSKQQPPSKSINIITKDLRLFFS